jgi:hypothetical protein
VTSIGVLLVILGVGSLILPNLGLQFQLMELVDPYQPWAGIVVAALGLVLVLVASRRKSGDIAEAEATAAAVTPASPALPAAAPSSAATPPSPVAPTAPPPAPPAATESKPWPTEPPERSDD